jgi:ATP-binding cassette subfamily B protein
VILDEPLTGLDAAAAAAVMEALENLMRGRTVVIIMHQLAVVQRAAQTVVLVDGKIAEKGSHQELIEVGGRYHQLFRLQSKEIMGAQS